MPIVVKHGTNPSTQLAAGYAAAQAKARTDVAQKALEAGERRDAREDQQAHQIAMQKGQQEFQIGMASNRAASQAGMASDRAEADRQRMIDEFGLRREEVEFKLTAKQKADEKKYSDAYAEIDNNENFSDEEKTEAKRRLSAKIAGIKPLPRRKEDSPWPEGQRVGQSWKNPKTGMIESRKPDGTLDMKPDPSAVTNKDRVAAWKVALEMARNDEGLVDTDEAEKIMRRMLPGQGGETGPSTLDVVNNFLDRNRRDGAPESAEGGQPVRTLPPTTGEELPDPSRVLSAESQANRLAAKGDQSGLPLPAGGADPRQPAVMTDPIDAAAQQYLASPPGPEKEQAGQQARAAFQQRVDQRLSEGSAGQRFKVERKPSGKKSSRGTDITHENARRLSVRAKLSPEQSERVHAAVTEFREAQGATAKAEAYKQWMVLKQEFKIGKASK